ncbi:MAG: hypothetical protein JSS87_09020 [Acidobacteria bacterium]|nr:hypothetical protein [Acidobacteriota bacterium]
MIVLLGGDERGVGKTALVCAVIAQFPRMPWTAVKVSPNDDDMIYMHQEREASGESATGRMLAAGAASAFLMGASAQRLGDLAQMLSHMAQGSALIVESTALRAHLEPDLFLCVMEQKAPHKTSLQQHWKLADVLFTRGHAWETEQPVFQMDVEHGMAVLNGEAKKFLAERIIK